MENKPLSDRELEILELVSQGKSNKQIASDLFISINTVKVHLSNIFRKIDVNTRTEATLYAMEHGIVKQAQNGSGYFEASDEERLKKESFERNNRISNLTVLGLVAFLFLLGTIVFFTTRPTRPDDSEILSILSENRWVKMDDLPIPLSQTTALTYDGKIYLFGGMTESGVSGQVWVYDIQGNSWTRRSDKPTAASDLKAAILGENIYLPGGIDDQGNALSIVEVYNGASDSWTIAAPLPQPLSNYAIEVFAGKIFIIGGKSGDKVQNNIYSYDPVSNQWQIEQPLTSKRFNLESILWGGRIYLVGGNDGITDLATVESFVPALSQNSTIIFREERSLPEPSSNCSGEQILDTLFVICPTKIMKLATDRSSWITEPNPPTFNLDPGFATTNLSNNLYIMGGISESGKAGSAFIRYQALYSIMLPVLTND